MQCILLNYRKAKGKCQPLPQNLWIYDIGWTLSTIMSNDIIACHCSHQRACFERSACDMWQDHNIFHGHQFWLDGRFIFKYVESRTCDSSGLQCLYKGFLIDNRSSGSVDEYGGRLHQPQLAFTDQVMSRRHIRGMDTDKI